MKSPARLLIEEHPRSGLFNMAADAWLAEQASADSSIPVIRFYCWVPSAISLGCHQSERVVDLTQASLHGWDVVKRPTGGRALLHDGDVSYSVILPGGLSDLGSLPALYNAVGLGICMLFNHLGADVDLVQAGRRRAYQTPSIRDGLCLDSRTRGEVVWRGKKVAASAQRLYTHSILQHGSIPLDGDTGAIASALPEQFSDRDSVAAHLRTQAATVREVVGRSVAATELIDVAVSSFADALGMNPFPDTWSEQELESIEGMSSRFETASDPVISPRFLLV